MPAFPLDTAQLVALFVECILYGNGLALSRLANLRRSLSQSRILQASTSSHSVCALESSGPANPPAC